MAVFERQRTDATAFEAEPSGSAFESPDWAIFEAVADAQPALGDWAVAYTLSSSGGLLKGLIADFTVDVTIRGNPQIAVVGGLGQWSMAYTLAGSPGLLVGGLGQWTLNVDIQATRGVLLGGVGSWAISIGADGAPGLIMGGGGAWTVSIALTGAPGLVGDTVQYLTGSFSIKPAVTGTVAIRPE